MNNRTWSYTPLIVKFALFRYNREKIRNRKTDS